MLTFEEYVDALKDLTADKEELEWRISYRKMQIRKSLGLEDWKSMFATDMELIYRNDDELIDYMYRLDVVQKRIDFVRNHGRRP